MVYREDMSNKVFEILDAKGMDTSVYAERDRLELEIKSLKATIYGYRGNGKWIVGKKERVETLFADLNKIPLSDTTKKEQRDLIKVQLTKAKSELDQLYTNLKSLIEKFNKLLEV